MSKLSKSEIGDYRLNNLTRLVLYLAFIVIGLVLYNKNYIKYSTVEKALGVTFIITGAIFVWMSSREKKIFLSNWDVIFGILASLSGLLIIINPGNLANSIMTYFGIFIMVCALQKLVVAIKLYKVKDSAALVTLITSLVILFLGIIVFFGPFNTMSINEQCGVFAILFGILEFANTVLLNDHEKAIVKKSN
ncbi:MAG: DUF308 domain-containing protein [Bacilli bacterium]|nr:DUF308 domain-containing protein [Bacilli bacterium]